MMNRLPIKVFTASLVLLLSLYAIGAEESAQFTSASAVAAQGKRTQVIAQARSQYVAVLKSVQSDVMKVGQLEEANRIARMIEDPDATIADSITSLRGKAAQTGYKAAIQRANTEYVIGLKAALNASLRDRQLDESNHIAAEIKRLEESTAMAAKSTPGFLNLLPLINPEKHTVQGKWAMENGVLVSSGEGEERLQIPYEPAEEYDYQITFTKVGTNCVVQNLVGNGRPFIWVMGNSGSFTFHYLKGAGIGANKTTVKQASGISDKRRYVSLVKVRKTGVEAFLNGKLVSKWNTDFSDAEPAGFWALRNRKCLGVGAGSSKVSLHAVEVREVTGKGVPQ
jgi:hypothetical protein